MTKPAVHALLISAVGEHTMRNRVAAGLTAWTAIRRFEFGGAAYVAAVPHALEVRIEIEASAARG